MPTRSYADIILGGFNNVGQAIDANRERADQKQRWSDQLGLQRDEFDWRKGTDERNFGYRQTRDQADDVYRNSRAGAADRQWEAEFGLRRNADQRAAEQARYDRFNTFQPIGSGLVNTRTGQVINPSRPPLQAADRRAIMEADEGVQAGENVIRGLQQALELSPQAYSGPFAGMRGDIAGVFGSEAGQNTQNLRNIVTRQALDSLRATFGGNPTEGERRILIEVQGSADQPPAVREAIFRRAIEAAQRRMEFNREQARALRTGEYYAPGYGGASAAPAPGGQDDPLGIR